MIDHNNKVIAVEWCVDDVLEVRPDLEPDQAWEVLLRVEHIHDAEIGISWDTLRIVADDMFPEEENETDHADA